MRNATSCKLLATRVVLLFAIVLVSTLRRLLVTLSDRMVRIALRPAPGVDGTPRRTSEQLTIDFEFYWVLDFPHCTVNQTK